MSTLTTVSIINLEVTKKMNTSFIFIFTILLIIMEVFSATSWYTGAIDGTLKCQQISITFTANTNYLNVQFKVTNIAMSSVLMVGNFSQIPCSAFNLSYLSALQIADSPLLKNMDIKGTIFGNPQVINIVPPANAQTVYFSFFNFDAGIADKSYSIGLTNSNSFMCFSCPSGTNRDPANSSCQCQPCPYDYEGSICQTYLQPLSQNQQIQRDLFSRSNAYFRIRNPSQLVQLKVKQLTANSDITLYVQYEYRDGMVAGALNNYYVNNIAPYQYTLTGSQAIISIPVNGRNILLTFGHPVTGISTFKVVFGNQSKPNILAIVLGSIFGFIGLCFIICGIRYIRKKYIRQTRVVNQNQVKISEHLTAQEIQIYFPEVAAILVIQDNVALPQSQINNSVAELDCDDRTSRQRKQWECCICLSQIEQKDLIRVTYCRHLFHGKCLISWFQKNQNCPYCRRQFTATTTEQMFLIHQDNKKKQKRGIDLVRSILKESIAVQKQKQKIVKMQQLEKEKEQAYPQNQQEEIEHD